MDEPLLLTTDTDGAGGVLPGAAVLLPAALVHPFTVCVTEKVPELNTVIDDDVEPLLHNSVPVKPLAVNVDWPQPFTTDTDGAGGVLFGAAVLLPAALVHPFTVCVTVNEPELNTVIDDDVEPVLHNSVPV